MALQIEEFELAWSSLSTSSDASGWRSIPVSVAGPCALCAGIFFPGKEQALLASFSTLVMAPAEKLPDGQGFAVSRVESHGDGKSWLALTRKPSGSVELFSTMVADVVAALKAESASDEPRLLRVFLGRIRAWQEFMRKGIQTLSPEAEIGLIGELTVLEAAIDAGLAPVLAFEAWVGPYDGIQDIELGSGAIEVKATLSAVGFPAKIGSLEQLDNATRQPLFVAGSRLKLAAGGQALPDFVASLRLAASEDAEAERLFSERILAAGYFNIHADRYTRRFVLVGMRVVEVGDGFPRLTRGNVPAGVHKAFYEIDLDKSPGEDVGVAGALKKLGVA